MGAAIGVLGVVLQLQVIFPALGKTVGITPTPRALSPDVQRLGWLGLVCCMPPVHFPPGQCLAEDLSPGET